MQDGDRGAASASGPVKALEGTLRSLAIPIPSALPDGVLEAAPEQYWRHAPRLVTDALAARLWNEWNPSRVRRLEQDKYVPAFRRLLAAAAAMGLRLDRFRDVAERLPEPDDGVGNWISFFEDVVSSADTFGVRLLVDPEQHQEFQRGAPQQRDSNAPGLHHSLRILNAALFHELGLVLPPIQVLPDDSLDPSHFRFEWNDLLLAPRATLPAGRLLVNATTERLRLLDVWPAEEATNPNTGAKAALIDSASRDACTQAGLTTWDRREYVTLVMGSTLRSAAGSFVTRAFVELLLLRLGELNRELVAIAASALDRDWLVQVVRGLLSEQISIRNFQAVLQAAVGGAVSGKADLSRYIVFGLSSPMIRGRSATALTPQDDVEAIRCALKRQISHNYTRGSSTLLVFLLDRTLEERLQRSPDITEVERRLLLEAVRREVESLPPATQQPVILTTYEVRAVVRRAIQPEVSLEVLSYQELSPDLNIQPVSRITGDELEHAPFHQLLSVFPLSSGRPRVAAAPPAASEPAPVHLLALHRDRVVAVVRAEIEKRDWATSYAERLTASLQDVTERLVDGYIELLRGHDPVTLDETLAAALNARGIEGARGELLHFVLAVADAFRETVVDEAAPAVTAGDSAAALRGLRSSLDLLDGVRHKALGRFAELSKLARVIQ